MVFPEVSCRKQWGHWRTIWIEKWFHWLKLNYLLWINFQFTRFRKHICVEIESFPTFISCFWQSACAIVIGWNSPTLHVKDLRILFDTIKYTIVMWLFVAVVLTDACFSYYSVFFNSGTDYRLLNASIVFTSKIWHGNLASTLIPRNNSKIIKRLAGAFFNAQLIHKVINLNQQMPFLSLDGLSLFLRIAVC